MSKFAIIATGAKQYLVKDGDVITVEKLGKEKGAKVTFDQVLLTAEGDKVSVGMPTVSGAKVSGEVLGEGKAPKKIVLRYRQKSRYMKKKGHRQPYTKVKITAIS